MRYIYRLSGASLWLLLLLTAPMGFVMSAEQMTKTAHQFSFNAIDGRALPLSQYNGKAVLIVNTASRCGFTPHMRICNTSGSGTRTEGWWSWGSFQRFRRTGAGNGVRDQSFLRGKFRRKFSTNGEVYCQRQQSSPVLSMGWGQLRGDGKTAMEFSQISDHAGWPSCRLVFVHHIASFRTSYTGG